MVRRPRVLIVSKIGALRETRMLVLQRQYEAVSATGFRELGDAGLTFDAVLLCYGLSPAERAESMALVRERMPKAKIVLLASYFGEYAGLACDGVAVTTDGPAGLLFLLDLLLEPTMREAPAKLPGSGLPN